MNWPRAERLLASPPIRTVVLQGDAGQFSPLTFDSFASVLRCLAAPYCAVGAMVGETVAGLAFGFTEVLADGRTQATLLSIRVIPLLRGVGVGIALLQAWEEAACRAGAVSCFGRYSGQLPMRPALEALLAAAGWEPPALVKLQIVGEAGSMARAGETWRAVRRVIKTADIEMVPWDVTESDRARIAQLVAHPSCIPYLEPLQHGARIAQDVSIAIRRGGELLGWVLGERLEQSLGPETMVAGAVCIHYFATYLDPSLWSRGIAMSAFHHAFTRQAAVFGPRSRAIYVTTPSVPRMMELTRKRFSPIALRVDEVFSTRKTCA